MGRGGWTAPLASRLNRALQLVRDVLVTLVSVVLIATGWGKWVQEPVWYVIDTFGAVFNTFDNQCRTPDKEGEEVGLLLREHNLSALPVVPIYWTAALPRLPTYRSERSHPRHAQGEEGSDGPGGSLPSAADASHALDLTNVPAVQDDSSDHYRAA